MTRKILLVDDEVAILLTMKAILELNGFQVETANSARDAVSKLKKAEYQMVITDLKMETEDAGYEVIRAARKQSYDPATAILTAFPSLGGDWQQAGANRLLVKPVGTEDLLRQIEAILIHHEDQKSKRKAKAAAADATALLQKGNGRASARKAG